MSTSSLLPLLVFAPFVLGIVSFAIGTKDRLARDIFVIISAILEFAGFLYLFYVGFVQNINIADFKLSGFAGLGIAFTIDGFRAVYALIIGIMWLMSAFLSKQYFSHYNNENRFFMFFLITLGATTGVFLSADLFTTFIFFEIMSFTSYTWVAQDESSPALRASATYLAIAVIGGLVMLMGLFILYHETGTLEINRLYEACALVSDRKLIYISALLMLFGFGAKAGAFPLHIWLPKAHPVAPAPASALLSGILTKSGIFGVLVITCQILRYDARWGTFMLLIGVCTMVVGAVLAMFSIDLKRTLACSSVSQIGFILVGVGMIGLLGEENGLATSGTLLHMINHSLFKLVLFMAAGVVFMNLHSLDLNKLRGFGRKKPLLNVIFLFGALGIGGIPLFNGYVSKTLLHESIVEYTELLEEGVIAPFILNAHAMEMIEWIFLISGGITVAYMTKLYVCLFVEENKDKQLQKKYDDNKNYMTKLSGVALLLPALLFPIFGIFASKIMDGFAILATSFMHAPHEHEYVNYLSTSNLKGGLTSICIGFAIYFIIIRLLLMKKTAKDDKSREYVNLWPKELDLEDNFYRPLLLGVLPMFGAFFARICDSLLDGIVVLLRRTVYKDRKIPVEYPEGNAITNTLGAIAEGFQDMFNRLRKSGKPKNVDYKHKIAVRYESDKENLFVISRSMSFGLMLFCIGLIITLVYLLL